MQLWDWLTGFYPFICFFRNSSQSSIPESFEHTPTHHQTTRIMAQTGRFASLSDGDLEGLILDKNANNTKSVVRTSKKIISDFLREKYGELKSLE